MKRTRLHEEILRKIAGSLAILPDDLIVGKKTELLGIQVSADFLSRELEKHLIKEGLVTKKGREENEEELIFTEREVK